jgi:hypothetical protein
MELHIFTNSTPLSPDTWHIENTYNSFLDTFGEYSPVVWCDPHPNTAKSAEYIKNLNSLFKDVRVSNSLADGYVKAVKSSTSEYIFMLEHDWLFRKPIDSIEEILYMMDKHEITHLRFNKRRNEAVGCDKKLTEVEGKFCWTTCASNNPHIIHKERWMKEVFPKIIVGKAKYGLEQRLQDRGIRAAIYGPLFLERKVQHTDGTGRKRVKSQKPS